jgi:hypothetical protein
MLLAVTCAGEHDVTVCDNPCTAASSCVWHHCTKGILLLLSRWLQVTPAVPPAALPAASPAALEPCCSLLLLLLLLLPVTQMHHWLLPAGVQTAALK